MAFYSRSPYGFVVDKIGKETVKHRMAVFKNIFGLLETLLTTG